MFRTLAPLPLLLAAVLLAGCPGEEKAEECASGLTRCGLACVDTATDAAKFVSLELCESESRGG